MALDYTRTPIQLANELRISRKRYAYWLHSQFPATSNSDPVLMSGTNAYSAAANDEQRALENAYNILESHAQSLAQMWDTWRETMAERFGSIFAADMPIWTDIDRSSGLIDYSYTNTNGTIAIKDRLGVFGALRKQMTTDGYYVATNGVTFGTLTAQSGNIGTTPTVTAMTGEGHALTGTLIFECTDDNVGAPKFTVRNRLTAPLPTSTASNDFFDVTQGYFDVLGDNLLQCERSWEDGPTGITSTLTRPGLAAPTEAGDGFAIVASSSFTNPTETDTDHGKIYITIYREAANVWRVKWYKDSSLSTLVQQTTTTGTLGTEAISMLAAGGTTFATTFSWTNAHVNLPNVGDNDVDITFTIGTPRIGDRWYRAVTNDEAGAYQTKLASTCHASLPIAGATAEFTAANATSISVS